MSFFVPGQISPSVLLRSTSLFSQHTQKRRSVQISSNLESSPSLNMDKTKDQESYSGQAGLYDKQESVALMHQTLQAIPTLSAILYSKQLQPLTDHQSAGLEVKLSQINLADNKAFTSVSNYFVHKSGPNPSLSAEKTGPCTTANATWRISTPCGTRCLQGKSVEGSEAVVMQVVEDGYVCNEWEVPDSVHGPVFNDGWFSSGAAWSPDFTRVAYVAQRPKPKKVKWGSGDSPDDSSEPPGDKKEDKKEDKNKGKTTKRTWTPRYAEAEDWGEQYAGMEMPAVFVVTVENGAVYRVSPDIDDMSFGSIQWTPQGDGLLSSAWDKYPQKSIGKKLGMIYCFNRPISLHFLPAPTSVSDQVTAFPVVDEGSVLGGGIWGSESSLVCPRFSLSGEQLILLSHECSVDSGTHFGTAQIKHTTWNKTIPTTEALESLKDSTLVPLLPIRTQPRPESPTPNDTKKYFPGLYTDTLLPQPFITESTIIFNTQWHNVVTSATLHLPTALSQTPSANATWPDAPGVTNIGAQVCDACGAHDVSCVSTRGVLGGENSGWVSVLVQNVVRTPSVHVVEVTGGAEARVSGVCDAHKSPACVTMPDGTKMELDEPIGDVHEHTWFEDGHAVSGVVVTPKTTDNNKPAGVLWMHGGPHGSYACAWRDGFQLLLRQGYAVVLPNYRGSIGFGEAALTSLPGHVGDYDIKDSMKLLDYAVDQGLVDGNRLAVGGGSHGGLLTGHAVGQYPNRFKAGALLNPVTNIPLMVMISDIPDWCFVESLGCGAHKTITPQISKEQEDAMFNSSPIKYVNQVTTPVLFALGRADRRVVMEDALHYITVLRTLKKDVEVYVFPQDCHPLDKPQTNSQVWVSIIAWFNKYTQQLSG